MNRFSTPLFGSLLGIASMSRIRSAILCGGSARRHGPSLAFGQMTSVNSVPAFAGRHFAGTETRRFSSTPCRYSELKYVGPPVSFDSISRYSRFLADTPYPTTLHFLPQFPTGCQRFSRLFL